MDVFQSEIVSNKKYGTNLFKLEIFCPYICKNASAGQFINIKCSESLNTDPLLRRPFSIYDIDKKFNVFSILFLLKGKGTHYLASKKRGDILDFIGPLGKGFFSIKKSDNINLNFNKGIEASEDEVNNFVLIGGGIGVAPLYLLAKELKEKNKNVFFIAGFRDETFFYWQKDLEKLLKDYYLFTENGSFGQKGLATDYIKEDINRFIGKQIVVCGPRDMLITLQKIFKPKNISAYVIMEEIIACGIGACIGCVIKVKIGEKKFEYRRVCADGPIFKLEEVCFE